MSTEPFIRSLLLQNFLSYSGNSKPVELSSLNVLIGPNGAGKSNFIEAINLLHTLPKDFAQPIREGGAISEWLWKGATKIPVAKIEAEVSNESKKPALKYRLEFSEIRQRLEIVDEALENANRAYGEDDTYFYYRYQRGRPILNIQGTDEKRSLKREDLIPDQSIFSQRKDPVSYPELTYLNEQFSSLRIYRDWQFGRNAKIRGYQDAAMPAGFLLEEMDNFAMVLTRLRNQITTKKSIISTLKEFLPSVEDLLTEVLGGRVGFALEEKKLSRVTPSTRLSDGTLRFLFLLITLGHPEPPPVICIEEPELGLHPDALRIVGELLIKASERTQLVITTHSASLLAALKPEHILVCEKQEEGTFINRLNSDDLKDWLNDYTLGDLWRIGEIGGNP